MKKIFIIILNFNGGRDTVECLNSLKKEKAKILVVDNGSADNSVQLIADQFQIGRPHFRLRSKVKETFPKIKIIKNKKNLGFAAGNNVGIKYALKQGADAVLLLNQDTVVEKGFLEPLLENPADIVGPVIKFKRKGATIYDLGGRVNFTLGRNYHLESKSIKKAKGADYISGCAMLIKKPVFEKIGLLDEQFFLYFEDADFCLRAKKAGFKIAVEPNSIIFHKLAEGKKKSWLQIYHLLRSNLIFINRYVSFWKRPLAYLYWWVLSIKMLLIRLL